MECWIYKSRRRAETYLFLGEPDDTSRVPPELLAAMGALELVMQLELDPERRLARADPRKVMHELEHRGYYLQLPPVDMPGPGRLQ